MSSHLSSAVGFACLLGLSTIQGMTIIPPVNLVELGKASDAVVIARARSSRVTGEEFFTTRTTFVIEEVLRGVLTPGGTIEVEVPGGVRGDQVHIVHGSPSFEPEATYFLCLLETSEAVWAPRMASYGVLKESSAAEGGGPWLEPLREARFNALSRPDGRAVDPVLTYGKAGFIGHFRDCLLGTAVWNRRLAAASETITLAATPPGCSYHAFATGGTSYAFRWFQFDSGTPIAIAADQTNDLQVDALSVVPAAIATWNAPSIPNTSLKVNYAGTVPVTPNCASPDPFTAQGLVSNTIVFNDPCRIIPDLTAMGGVVAQGGLRAGLDGTLTVTRHARDGCDFWAEIEECYVIVNNNIWGGFGLSSLDTYRLALTHELGHSLGFDHVADPNALMNATCCHPLNATDIACAQFAYPEPVPAITLSTTSHDFGSVNLGAAPVVPINIRSTGLVNLNVSGVTITGPAASQFSVQAPANLIIHPCATEPSFNIQVTYRPTVAGAHTATLNIPHNAPGSPASVTLAGTGVVADIQVTPTNVAFGDVTVGVLEARPLQIENAGSSLLSIGGISLLEGNRGFAISESPGTVLLLPNQSLLLEVTFTPSSRGLLQDQLRVTSDDPDEPQVNIPLSGTGLAPMIQVTPPSLNFGGVSLGSLPALRSANIANVGTAPLAILEVRFVGSNFHQNGTPEDVLLPGASMDLGVAYIPDDIGPDQGSIFIQSDDPDRPETVVDLSGSGVPPLGGAQAPMDCNQDGRADISDPICALGFLFNGSPSSLPCGDPGDPEPDGPVGQADLALMDWNGDGRLDLSDPVAALSFLFSTGEAHVLGNACTRISGCPDACAP